ncbi:MAG TPA: FG-GAP-like repeat-containing protein [Candidatus Polarisedimenticolia bacterium]|nr:FG-GAP-like repeat-containing protein [Candidatus Polarisedimenticolia bacterium]
MSRSAAWWLLLGAAAAAPAGAAVLPRPVVQLDGDASLHALDSEELLLARSGQTSGTEFGSAAAIEDVDGDGLQDAIVGQRAANRVSIYRGRRSAADAPYAADPAAADVVLTAGAGGVQQFGFAVAAADLDGDGLAEVIVGAPFSDAAGRSDQGAAYVIRGAGALPSGTVLDVTAPAPAGVEVLVLGRGAEAAAGDLLGFALAVMRRGSAAPRLVVTARGAGAPSPPRPGAGAAHVVAGPSLPPGGTFDLSLGSETTIFGADASDAFGEWAAACDVDGAGEEDLLVGAIFGDGPANAGVNRGEALLFLGENLTGGHFGPQAGAADADLTLSGATNGDDLGYSVACADLNGDGLGDMVAGALFADAAAESRPSAGELYVVRGRPSVPGAGGRRVLIDPLTSAAQQPIDLGAQPGYPDLTLLGATTGDQLGFSAAAGDLDGDGVGDLMAGARLYDRSQSAVNTGIVYLLLGGSSLLSRPSPAAGRVIDLRAGTVRDVVPGYVAGTPLDHLPDSVEGVILGASAEDNAAFVLAAGDLNGDGADEAMVAAIGDLSRAPGFRGEVYLLSYRDVDGDGASDLSDGDNDNDGLRDAEEDADGDGVLDPAETSPFDPDTDGDGIQDGTEQGVTCRGGGGSVEVDCDDPAHPYTSTVASLPLHFVPDADPATVTDPRDRDSDDDGVADGSEDLLRDGFAGAGEMDPSRHDTDGDLIFDGTELGRTAPLADTDLSAGHFVPDADAGASTTDPTDPDTDVDGLPDGLEDGDRNGAVAGDADFDAEVDLGEVWLETDPADDDTDRDRIPDGREDADRDGTVDPGETDPLDQDSDDDGLPDGWVDGVNGQPLDGLQTALEGEDLDGDGVFDPVGESDPRTHDTDGDGLTDGVECGLGGSGAPGRDGVADTGPGQGGTDPTSPRFRLDADRGRNGSVSDPTSPDSDLDLIPDGVEDADRDGAVLGDADFDYVVDPGEVWMETDATDPDSDFDGLDDGLEDRDRDGSVDPGETNPRDQDSDDDGLPDGWIDGANGSPRDGFFQAPEGEDRDRDGVWGTDETGQAESSPLQADSDGDGLLDGVEAGLGSGGGVAGRNGQPDSGPGEDGTDPTSPAFRPDADAGATATDPWDADTDDDGLADGGPQGEDVDGDGERGPGETDAADSDTDGDGLKDGLERGVVPPGVLGPDGVADPGAPVKDGTAGGLATDFDTHPASTTDPLDADTDDDGLSDGAEDTMSNGAVDPGESDPNDHDTDGDLLFDGLERGRTLGVGADTDPAAGHFIPDADPSTTTDPALADTDGGSAPDGEEDADRDGAVDPGERDPRVRFDDDRSGALLLTDPAGSPIGTIPAGQTLHLRLDDDRDEDLAPDVAETVTAACLTDGGDQETVTLTAVSPAGGVFAGSIPTAAGAAAPADGVIQLAGGDNVTCTYTDLQDPVDVRTAAAAAASSPQPLPEVELSLEGSGLLFWGPAAGSLAPPEGALYNVYRGAPETLAATGVYTQQAAACGHPSASLLDDAIPQAGRVVYYLVAVMLDGLEGPLGKDSAGAPRPSTEPCSP